MKDHFTEFARYNAWANGLLYDAVAAMPDEAYRADEGLFFRSVHGTLNHVIVADLIWMARFAEAQHAPLALSDILYERFDELRAAREAMDRRIVDWFDRLDEEDYAGEFTYTPVTIPEPVTQRRALAMAHFFNHQTHHRGQVHAVVTRRTDVTPEIDLIYFQRHRRLGEI